MSKTKKALSTTLSLTIILFGFIIFLLYVIYCYAYYDKYLEYEYANKFNNKEYKFVYDKMIGKGNLTYEQFIFGIENVSNKDKIKNIFNTYYKDSGLYNEKDFLNTYLFDLKNITEENIKFSSNGKTNLFTRRAIFYDDIKVNNSNGFIKFGVFNKVMFEVESNSILRVDNKELECSNNICTIDKLYGGIYEINYVSNGYEYYALVNINKDKQKINVTNLENLVKVKKVNANLKYGRYLLTDCEGFCPVLNRSYLMINEDNTYYLYNYNKDGQNYNVSGKYSIDNNYIIFDNKDSYTISSNELIGETINFTYSYDD